MAVRRLQHRDRVYFYDFFQSVMAVDSENYEFDITEMAHPIHGIVQQVPNILGEAEAADGTSSEQIINEKLHNLECLYHLCMTAGMVNNLSNPIHNHVLFTLMESIVQLKTDSNLSETERSLLLGFLKNKVFDDVLENGVFAAESRAVLVSKNKLFEQDELLDEQLDSYKAMFGDMYNCEFLMELVSNIIQHNSEENVKISSGLNLFEFYFSVLVAFGEFELENGLILEMYCKLLNIALSHESGVVGTGFYELYILSPGEMFFHLVKFILEYQNGFYLNQFVSAPLQYACAHNMEPIVNFFCDWIHFKQKQFENKDTIFRLAAEQIIYANSNTSLLRKLLSCYNFVRDDKNVPSLVEIAVSQCLAIKSPGKIIESNNGNADTNDSNYYLEIIEILAEFGCDFTISSKNINNIDSNSNNLLMRAITAENAECVETIIKCCRSRDERYGINTSDDSKETEAKQAIDEDDDMKSQFRSGSDMLSEMFEVDAATKRKVLKNGANATSPSGRKTFELILECPEFSISPISNIPLLIGSNYQVCGFIFLILFISPVFVFFLRCVLILVLYVRNFF